MPNYNLGTANNTESPTFASSLQKPEALVVLPEYMAPVRPFLLSYTSSLFATTVSFPLDSIKTRMQTTFYKNPLHCFQVTIKSEGFKGLYRGFMAPLLSIACSKSLAVGLYSNFKPMISSSYQWINPPPKDLNKQRSYQLTSNIPISFISGSITGVLVTLWAAPFEFTKLYSQIVVVENKKLMKDLIAPELVKIDNSKVIKKEVSKGLFDVVKQIVKFEGIPGLYSGLRYHMLREFIGSGMYFGVYETTKTLLSPSSTSSSSLSSSNTNPIAIAVAGALSGVFSWATIFPIDTFKSLVQKDIVANILRHQKGIKQLKIERKLQWPTRKMYRGLSVTITRSVVNSVLFFGGYELLMKYVA